MFICYYCHNSARFKMFIVLFQLFWNSNALVLFVHLQRIWSIYFYHIFYYSLTCTVYCTLILYFCFTMSIIFVLSVSPGISLPRSMSVCIVHMSCAISVARFDRTWSETQLHPVAVEFIARSKQIDHVLHCWPYFTVCISLFGFHLLLQPAATQNTFKQARPSSGRPYIHTCRSYVHTPRDIDRHVITVALPTLIFTSGWVADSSDFWLLGTQSSPKWEIPYPGRSWTTVQNLTPLALFLPEKYVTVQIHKQ